MFRFDLAFVGVDVLIPAKRRDNPYEITGLKKMLPLSCPCVQLHSILRCVNQRSCFIATITP
uniref:Uncharacterized protein n=1 Tax=Ciona intestinalis TaxID=7719 RepID=H2XNH9_CIOIN